jgi:hypothetical protein
MSLPFDFTPVPLKARHDGWTYPLQRAFVVALARGASVDEAARRVGKSRATAYALRKRAGAQSFASAWDTALAYAKQMRIVAAREQPASAPLPPPARTAAEAEALLNRLFPGVLAHAGKGDKAGKADKADKADGVTRA